MTPNEFRRYALFYLGYYGALGAYTPYVSRWVDSLGHGAYVIGTVLALWYGGRILAPPAWSRLTAASATPGRWLVGGCVLATAGFATLGGAPPLAWITASNGRDTQLIMLEDVVYFRADSKYTVVATTDSEALIRKSIKELAEELDPTMFWQVHRSSVVNVHAIDSVVRDDRGNMTFFASYYSREAVGQGDRDVTRDAGVVYYDYDSVTGALQLFVPDHLTPANAYTSQFGANGFVGVFASGGSGTAEGKFAAMEKAGVTTVKSPGDLGAAIAKRLAK